MNNRLYTDDNMAFTIHGLSYKDKQSAIESIEKIDIVFNQIAKSIEPGTCSPEFIRPRVHLYTKLDIAKFILIQKMYRVLALNNRAKVLYRRTQKQSIGEAIEIFNNWLKQYKNLILKLVDIKLTRCKR
jgi:hypothetical protein